MISQETSERAAWRTVPQGWHQLYGDIEKTGVSVEWHDFTTARAFDWGQSFHPQSIEFCLNLGGRGAVGEKRARRDFLPATSGYYSITDDALSASREAKDHHQFVTLEFSRAHLRKQLADNESDLDADMRAAVFENRAHISTPGPMTIEQRRVVSSLAQPPVPRAAQALWYQSKALELMAHFLFESKDPELFCMRQKRVSRDRVERVKELLALDLAQPPALEKLGVEVGCSSFYLSRIFSREVGLTIPQYLRKIRMERAAELLRSGRYNVTEAAIEVGYSSLSHFSKAFCETIGCCPVLYPMAKNTILDR